MRKTLSFTLHGLCLLIAAGAIGLWVRSQFVADDFRWLVKPPLTFQSVGTVPGGLYIHRSPQFL
jgi:hypothetical protein